VPPAYQPLTLLDDGLGRGGSSTSCLKQVPALDLTKLKPGGGPGGQQWSHASCSNLYMHQITTVLHLL
jgi:hypothetical protein